MVHLAAESSDPSQRPAPRRRAVFLARRMLTLIVATAAVIGGMTAVVAYDLEHDSKIRATIHYSVRIFSNTTDRYTIVVPCTVDMAGNVVDLEYYEERSSGEASYDWVETDRGPGLLVDAVGTVDLPFIWTEVAPRREPEVMLSTTALHDDGTTESSLFSTLAGPTVTVRLSTNSYKVGGTPSGPDIVFALSSCAIQTGWNQVAGTYHGV